MWSRFVDSVLPGLRDIRAPLVSGLLWVAFGWMVLADKIDEGDSPVFLEQVSDAIDRIGTTTTLALASVLVYLVGVLAMSVVEPLGSAVGLVRARLRGDVGWQKHVRRRMRQLRADEVKVRDEIANLEPDSEALPGLEQRLHSYEDALAILTPARRWKRLHIARNAETLRAAGSSPSRQDRFKLAHEIIRGAWRTGVLDEIQRLKAEVSLHMLGEPDNELVIRLMSEVEQDPVDVVRALDDALYQAIDREKAERELRMSVTLPIAAISVWLALTGTPIAWVGVALAVITFARNAVHQSDEVYRILSLVALKKLQTPAVLAAEDNGRLAVQHIRR